MMADRRRWSPESSSRRKRDHKPSQHDRHIQYEEPDRMRSSRAVSPSSSSTSSSYLDISHISPYKAGLATFFTAPSERRRLRKRRSNRSLGGHSSSSSLNLDLAYGTGYIRRPKRREVRSRKGKEIDRERNREARREKDSNHNPTDAEILAVGAGLAKLARDQNKYDLKSGKGGRRAELVAVKEPAGSRGLGPSRVSHGSDSVDEDGWESASDDDSISSVDSRLAFGDDSGGWFGWSRPKPPPPSRKTSVVDPRFFGPANSLHGVVTEAVGFHDVTWDPSADHGKDNPFPIPRFETPPSGSQSSLQRVYPVATSDPSRFEAARSSVVSGSEPFVSSKHGELPLQQPQPYSPVSKNVFEPRYSAPSESGASKKSSSSHTRSKSSLAEAALAGVAVATAGAAIASERRDDRRRDSERDDRGKRRESDRRDPRDDRQREKRRERERRRDSDAPSSEKRRERRYDDPRYDDRDDYRERRRDDRPDTRYDDHYYGGQSSSTRVPVDPFQYQVADDAFETPKIESPVQRSMGGRTPTVVTVDREPDFSRFMSSSSRAEAKAAADRDAKEESSRGRDHREKELNDPAPGSEETGRSPVAAAAIGAAVAAASAERARKAVERRRDRGDDYDRREKDSAKEPEPTSKTARDPVQEEADRAYREIVMARKIASQVIRSRSSSPNRSVVEKYEGDDEPEEIIRIATPPAEDEEKEKEKKKGPYDAPDADFKLDLVLEDPRHLRDGSLPRIDFDTDGPSFKLDPDASKPRPFLNLVRPTPTPSPAPEKQVAEEESKKDSTSTTREVPESTTTQDVESKDTVPSSASSSKGVTWGENETKHYDVESPNEHKDEFISKSEVNDAVKEVEQPKPTRPAGKRSGWGAVVAGITGASMGAAVAGASEGSKSTSKSGDVDRDEKPVDEPRSTRSESSTAEPTQVPGAFNDDLDFTATVAAGLQDTGFDPNIVINDPSFRRRESPPGSNDKRAGAESFESRDLVEEPETYFEPAKLSKKEQRKRDKAAQRQESQSEEVAEAVVAEELVEEPDSYSTSSKKKSKKSKRESVNFDEAEESPRQSRRISIPVDAFEDLANGEEEWEEPKKSKKKSKRDSEVYDSPTRSVPSEVASEFDTSSGKKSKSKSKRKSGSYEVDPDPADISLPPSEPSEIGRDGADSESRTSRRSSRRDDDDRADSRSVASAEEESRKSKKKSRRGTKDEFDDTRSVASAPVEDNFEYSKSRKKDKRSSGGGFFGLFGSKSDVGTGEQSPKDLKDDFEEDTRRKSKKSKRQSLQDEPTAVDPDDQSRSASNGHTRSNGSRNGDDYDGVSKKSSKSERASEENDSFLDNAGILGAGAGLAGVAIALAAQHHQQSKADLEKSSTDRSVPSHQYDTTVDPEIVQRQFRPSIDPQYGDLLPLPPSVPTSPNLETFDALPELPDSRPDTPEAERFPRDRGMSSARKSLQDAPVKSPSQSAVPLKFIMGNRSQPASPGLARSSPLQSPVTQQESLVSPRNRPRPTSWDNSKEYKPLYLVETNRRNSIVQHNEPEGPLPELPPSQSTSRSGSEIDFHDAVSVLGPDDSSDELEHSTHPLSIDTALQSTEPRSELLGSQQSTPKAGMQPLDIESTRGLDPESDALPSLPPGSSLLLSSGEESGAQSVAAAAVASSIGYFASSPSHRATSQAWLDDLTSSPPAQPSPIDPMTKDRSSYLLQSSPLSKKAEDDEASDPTVESSTSRQLFSSADRDSLQSIEEREGDALPEIEDASRSIAEDNAQEATAEAEPADEFFMASSKKSKKDKKKAKQLARSAAFDDIPVPESSQETQPDDFAAPNADPVEEPSSGKSKKSKKKDKKAKSMSLDWEAQDAEAEPQPPADPLPEASQEPLEDSSAADDFAAVKTKGKKKKDKKKSRLSVSWDDTPEDNETPTSVDPEQAQETSREIVDSAAEPEEPKPESLDDGVQSGISPEVLKGLGIWGASSMIEKEEEESPAARDIEEPAAVETLPRDVPAEDVIEAPEVDKDAEVPPPSTAQEPDAGDEFFTTSKKSKKKGKKSRAEKLDEEASLDTATSTDRSATHVDAAEVSRPANVMDDFFEQASRSGSKKGKKKGKKSKAWDEEPEPEEDVSREPPAEDMETTKETAINDGPASPKTTYFPSSSHLHSPKKQSDSDSGGYFPSATAVLPVAAAGAALIGSSLLEKAKDQDTPDADSKASPHDGLAAGYDNDQLSLARQLQEEFGSGSKKSKKDKKKRQILPATSDRELSRSRSAEDEADVQPRARSLSVEPSPSAETPVGDRPNIYSEDQLELARQLKEEFGSGSKKSKKDKKKRPGLSRSATSFDEQVPDSGAEPSPSLPAEGTAEPAEVEDSARGDGFAAGYQEDQLSLARQLQAEFGSASKKSKKDKKGKKRDSMSQTPTLESENAGDYFGDAAQAPGSDLVQNDEPVESPESSTRDGFALGYSAEQLELARQLKEEFGSKSSKKDKKDKKDKKKKSLLRNSSEDPEESQPPPDADPETSNLEAAEAAPTEPAAADPDDEFTLTTKKKGKKGKKRDSLVPKSDSKDDELPPAEDVPEQEPEPLPADIAEPSASVNPEDEFAPVSKKGKKGKKGKKQDIAFETDHKEPAPEPVSTDKDAELEASPPAEAEATEPAADDEFAAFVSKKSKKGKKGKKQEVTFDVEDKEPEPEPEPSTDRGAELDATPLPETTEPAEDDFAPVSKKGKKGKKGKKQEVTFDVDDKEPALEPSSANKDVELGDAPPPESTEPAVDDEFAFVSKKSKKGKKGKKQEAAFESDDKEPTPEVPSADKDAELGDVSDAPDAPLLEPTEPVADDEFAFVSKKGKKGKKQEVTFEPDEKEPVAETLSADRDADLEGTPDAPVPEPTEPAIDDEFAFVSKKSKKGKKGKKQEAAFESDEKEPAQDLTPEPPTEKDMELEATPLPETSEPVADDEFAPVSKISKKGKKGKKRADAWDEEPSPETPPQEAEAQPEPEAAGEDSPDRALDDSAPAEKELTAEETKKEESLEMSRELPEEPSEELSFEDQVRALHDASAPQPAEPDTGLGEDPSPTDEFVFTTKKSKKGKKKQQSLAFEEPAESPVAPLESQPEQAVEPVADSQAPGADVEPAVNTDPTAEPDNTFEDFGFSTKKSKKDKKKRKSLLADEAAPSSSDPAVVPEESSEPQAASLDAKEPVEPATGDAAPAESLGDSIARDISDELAQEPVEEPVKEPVEEPVDDWSEFSVKKSKKDKKKRKSGISTPVEETPTVLEEEKPTAAEAVEEPVSELAVVDDYASAAPTSQDEPTPEPADEWGSFSTKKSKKDKKKKKSGLSTPAEDIPASTDEPREVENAEEPGSELAVIDDYANATPNAQEEPAPEPADEWGSFSTKKSKKDKKKKKSGLSTPAEETPASTEGTPREVETLEEPEVAPKPVDETPATIPEPEEAADEWGSFPTKKSKKDKKKRKSGLSTPAEEPPASTEEDKPRDVEPLEEPVEETPAPVIEPAEEATDEWGSFSTKKSKKDKKKRKSGLSTPAEEPPASTEDDKPGEVEGLEEPESVPAVADDGVAATVSQNDPPSEPVDDNDEWGSFTTKKSKKDKKKRKSGLSTPVEASTSLVEEEKPAATGEVSEPQPEPLPADEDIAAPKDDAPNEEVVDEPPVEEFEFTTKKSKKDKKKAKKASLFTVDDAPPPENTADAPVEPQPESAELERGLLHESPEPIADDDFGFATKKSKKSKKAKRESQNEPAADPVESNADKQSPAPASEQSGDRFPSGESQAREAPMLEPMPELTPTEAQGQTMDQPETTSEHPEWTLLHDKRKRQPTVDAAISKDLSVPQPISWADEVEEAEVERQLPVIDDIAKDESLSHIASTTHVDDFSRPAKKGKKGKKGKKVDLADFTAAGETSGDPVETRSVKEEPMQEDSKAAPILAAAGAILGGAALLGKSDKKADTFNEELGDSRDEQTREVVDLKDPEPEPVTPLSTKRYSHPGSSTLPIVEEESPEPIAPRPQYAQDVDDANRDSAFVTESPVPRQRGFADDLEYNRDSGVHLREASPSDKARAAASTDEALARMSWPPVDEESQTVDLHKSQRRNAEVYDKPHGAEEAHSEERSLPQDKETSSSHRRRHDDDSPIQPLTDHHHSLSPGQLHKGEPPSKHIRLESPKHDDDFSAGSRELPDARDGLPSQRDHPPKVGGLHRSPAVYTPSRLKEESSFGSVRQRVQRIESPDSTRTQKPSEERYGDLSSARRPKAEKPSSAHSSPTASGLGITGAAMGFAASRIASQEHRGVHNQSPGASPRSLSNINRLRSPDPRTPVRPDSRGSNASSVTPPLRRSDRKSGDLRSLSQRSKPDLAKDAELAGLNSPSTTSVNTATVSTANPTANEGRVRAKEMADVYDGFGEGRMGSPRSPTRPHSMRRRQSMQVLDLESRLEQLAAENRQLAEARAQAEQALQSTKNSSATLVERDAEIESLKRTLDWLQNEVTRLTEVNDGLNSANVTLASQHNERYGALESQHAQTSRELDEVRETHNNLMAGAGSMEDKDREIAQLRADLEAAKERIREMQVEILASKSRDAHFLVVRDEDYFDSACQKLCQHVQQWVLRFSKFSDMRACRLTSEINNDKTIDRLDNAILDGSDVDSYLSDRVKRRDVFMSMTMTMVWEFVFTRYLFGMDREQRQKLKSLEKLLSEVGPASAVHQWRATTLTLLSQREAFVQQREQDTLAVVHAVMETLSEILPPPSHLEGQIQEQLVRVIKAAVDLSIEMRTQRAEYMMLPPLQPEYDANGDLASKVSFNAALMNERSGDTTSNEELEEAGAVVKIVLFPLVVKRGDDGGEGDEEIVVCPAQVLVAKPKRSVRVFSPESAANQSRVSMQSTMPTEQQWERVDM